MDNQGGLAPLSTFRAYTCPIGLEAEQKTNKGAALGLRARPGDGGYVPTYREKTGLAGSVGSIRSVGGIRGIGRVGGIRSVGGIRGIGRVGGVGRIRSGGSVADGRHGVRRGFGRIGDVRRNLRAIEVGNELAAREERDGGEGVEDERFLRFADLHRGSARLVQKRMRVPKPPPVGVTYGAGRTFTVFFLED